MTASALTMAASDPSGGAGLQADLKTFHQHGLYGTSVVTLLTVQNTQSVYKAQPVDAALVRAQLDAVLHDIPPAAAKTGALGSAETIAVIADRAGAFGFPLVVDPSFISRLGTPLVTDDAVAVLRERLLPRAHVLTPNRFEAAVLVGADELDEADLARAARDIAALGPAHVVIRAHPRGAEGPDVLFSGGAVRELGGERVGSTALHGAGSVFSAAVTARLALGATAPDAIAAARAFVSRAMRTHPHLGHGEGPLDLHVAIE